jgi:hypothetical protein
VVWFAYPKQSSKKYVSEIDRDHGWAKLGAAGFEPVRMVAIDEDWSAVRFRRVDYIKTLSPTRGIRDLGGGQGQGGGEGETEAQLDEKVALLDPER